MVKELAILTVSVITLFVAAFAAFSIYDLDNTSSQSAAAEIKDYTTEFESIQSALNEVNEKLDTFESDTVTELQKIKSDLAEVKLITAKPEPIDTSSPFGITINKVIYSKGDTIIVSALNILPQKAMTFQLLSSFNELITTVTARSDSTGKLDYAFQIPSFVQPGDYKIKATLSDGNSDILFFTISDDTIPETTEPPITGLSVILDKPSYNPGDMIKVTGFGQANTGITAELISPDHEIATANSNTSSDSTYILIFILDADAEPGNWKLKVIQGDKEETLIFTVVN